MSSSRLPYTSTNGADRVNNWGETLKRVIISLAIVVFLQNSVVFFLGGGIRFRPNSNL